MKTEKRIVTDGLLFAIQELSEFRGFFGLVVKKEWRIIVYPAEYGKIYYTTRKAAQDVVDEMNKLHEWEPC